MLTKKARSDRGILRQPASRSQALHDDAVLPEKAPGRRPRADRRQPPPRGRAKEELRRLVNASEQAGLVEESEARIAGRFAFGDLDAGALMTPRIAIQAVPATAGLDDVLSRFTAGRHYRLRVYADSLDDILGAVHLRDLIRHGRDAPFDLRALVQPVLTIPQSRRADDLLEDMRRLGRHVAVVVDEYGSTAGIITLADLLRALVGEASGRYVSRAPATGTGTSRQRRWGRAPRRCRAHSRKSSASRPSPPPR